MKMEKQKRRHFGGALYVPPDLPNGERSPENRIDKILQEKSLKCYIRGDKGFNYKGDWFPTLEKWT